MEELTPAMVAKATDVAGDLVKGASSGGSIDVWTRLFATGDESIDRPLYRQYKEVILNTLVDVARAELERMRQNPIPAKPLGGAHMQSHPDGTAACWCGQRHEYV